MADNKIQPHKDNFNGFAHEIRYIIDNAHIHAVRSINHVRVVMYWFIGKRIFEEEQMGKNRAEYCTKDIFSYFCIKPFKK